jgi:glycosyltransferase involved in cell wall biosynthesis
MSNPLASVIIPVYNGERFLVDAIRSVLAQDYRPIEVIVVDDGSTDRSCEIAESFQEIRCVRQSNAGVAAARNAGLSAATGDFVAFLDQDDEWTPHNLTTQIGYLAGHPDVGYTLGREIQFLAPGMSKPDWLQQRMLDEPHLGVLTGAMVARKTAFSSVGGFDQAYKNTNDIDWFARAKHAGIISAHLDEIVLRKRVHETNESHHVEVSRLERMKVLMAAARRQRGKGESS